LTSGLEATVHKADEVEGLVVSEYIFFAYDENHLVKKV